ncbi:helix-turn-helix transcriptional regulator [Bacteroidales bacterium OttesenSCG-928-K03]|nr:helix-turn-helix transcriptional regulator [Bacteroidales bacterium OttesenSCG-928-K03]
MDEQREEYFKNLAKEFQNLVYKEKLYTNSQLSLDIMAGYLNASRYNVSYAINKYLGKNFHAFINELRIKEALQIIQDPDRPYKTVKEIAQTVGFNDRSSFYRVCKRITGVNPLELEDLCR